METLFLAYSSYLFCGTHVNISVDQKNTVYKSFWHKVFWKNDGHLQCIEIL